VPVAKYWPEFAQNGKSDILVRHLLSHTSGVAGWQEPVTLDDVLDVPKSTALLAEQALWWTPPASASGYHSLTYGHLIGEVVRRITGKTLGAFTTRYASPSRRISNLGWPASRTTHVYLMWCHHRLLRQQLHRRARPCSPDRSRPKSSPIRPLTPTGRTHGPGDRPRWAPGTAIRTVRVSRGYCPSYRRAGRRGREVVMVRLVSSSSLPAPST
jgi:hypothetical protein